MNVAIIGAGPAGLASARRVLEYGLNCTIFEMTDSVGGIWVYNDSTCYDENNPVNSCMYSSLKYVTEKFYLLFKIILRDLKYLRRTKNFHFRTNLPTVLMEFTGFKFQPKSGLCYPGHEEVLQYIKDFAGAYNLFPYIKVRQLLVYLACVRPLATKFGQRRLTVNSYIMDLYFLSDFLKISL